MNNNNNYSNNDWKKKQNKNKKNKIKSSWEGSHKWYNKIVSEEGHYYHQQVILPALLKLIDSKKTKSLLDLGCGQGVLARALPQDIEYTGIDLSSSLIKSAKTLSKKKKQKQEFLVGDITQKLPVKKNDFDTAVLLLSLQNIEDGEIAIKNASAHLKNQGHLIIVLNHPSFRIPKQSSWHFEDKNHKTTMSRLIQGYLSPLKIPIQTAPSQGQKSALTYSYHHPLSTYSVWLKKHHFYIEEMQELISDKTSTGGRAKAENKGRKEIPLFLVISAIKIKMGSV